MSGISGMAGMGAGDICGNVNSGERCGSLTKPKQQAGLGPALLFVKASGAGVVRRWT
jgi:hypothetical protein